AAGLLRLAKYYQANCWFECRTARNQFRKFPRAQSTVPGTNCRECGFPERSRPHVGSLKFEQRRQYMPPNTSPEENPAHSQACCNSYVSSERDEGRWIWGGSPVLENSQRLLRRRLPPLRNGSQVNIRLHTGRAGNFREHDGWRAKALDNLL